MKDFFILSLLAGVILVASSEIKVNKSLNNVNNKIVEGQTAHTGQFPFMVSIHHEDDGFLGGGFLISTTWVITSAHSIANYRVDPFQKLQVTVGGLTHTGIEPGKYSIKVNNFTMHHNYETINNFRHNNIALLNLVTPVKVSETIQPIMLAEQDEVVLPGDDNLLSAGWGGNNDESPTDKLQYANRLRVKDNVDCSYDFGMFLDDYNICTQVFTLESACEYDTGDPLFRHDPEHGYVAVGVVNYTPCGKGEIPNVYSSIPKHRYWINAYTGI